MQIKTTVRYKHVTVRMAETRRQAIPNVGIDAEQLEFSYSVGGGVILQNHLTVSTKAEHKPTL